MHSKLQKLNCNESLKEQQEPHCLKLKKEIKSTILNEDIDVKQMQQMKQKIITSDQDDSTLNTDSGVDSFSNRTFFI